jgi:23S rRNA pseudoU1915 N3-methylase RlmH
MAHLKRVMGTLSEQEFAIAAEKHPRMAAEHVAAARAFLVHPGRLQVLIAGDYGISKQLVHRHCKKLYVTHCELTETNQ